MQANSCSWKSVKRAETCGDAGYSRDKNGTCSWGKRFGLTIRRPLKVGLMPFLGRKTGLLLVDNLTRKRWQSHQMEVNGHAIRPGVSLTYPFFQGAFLVDADLRSSKLRRPNFEQAKARRIHFESSELLRPIFIGAELRGAHFEGAQLVRPDFTGADLYLAHFEGSTLIDPIFDNANLCDSDFENASISKPSFRGANLTNVRNFPLNFIGTAFEGAMINGRRYRSES